MTTPQVPQPHHAHHKKSGESGTRPLIHWSTPAQHGPGWTPPDQLEDDSEDPYRRYAPARKNANEKSRAVPDTTTATKKSGRKPEKKKHRKRGVAREILHDILTVLGEFVGTVSSP